MASGHGAASVKKLTWALLAAVLLVVGLGLASLNPIRNLIDGVFGRDTISASGGVVLERLRESETLEAAKGTFNFRWSSATGRRSRSRIERTPTLADPSVDAETGVLIVGLDTSIFPGKLPDDYLSDAAAEGKRAVNGVAERSGLLDLAKSSASGLFESLLTSLGFTDVEIVFANPSGGA